MKITPYGQRALIRPLLKEEISKKSASGIILVNDESKEKSEQGIVIETAIKGILKDNRVVFSKYGYESITDDGEELYLIKEENILAIIQ